MGCPLMAGRSRSQTPRNAAEARRLIDGLMKQLQEFETSLSVDMERQATLGNELQSLRSTHEKLAEQAFPFLTKRATLKAEVESVRKNPKYRRMWTSWNGDPTAEGKRLISTLEAQLADIEHTLTRLAQQADSCKYGNGTRYFALALHGHDASRVTTPFSFAVNECLRQQNDNVVRIEATKRAIQRTGGEIEQARSQLAKLEARQLKRDKDRAFLAQAKGKSRDQAEAVKKHLTKTEKCPYCCCPLGDEPHADHIYPQSKGGLSTVRNMIYVCQQCNVQKSDLTLISFIEAFSLDRSRIESTLRDLDKDF